MNYFTTFAYLDPGTGSMLLQAFMGGFAGLCVFSKWFWDTVLHSKLKSK